PFTGQDIAERTSHDRPAQYLLTAGSGKSGFCLSFRRTSDSWPTHPTKCRRLKMKGHQLYGPHSHDYLKSLIFSALLSESVLTLLSFCDELHIAPHSKT